MNIEVFTDGACRGNPGPGSWAFIVYKDGKYDGSQSGFDRQTTNNKMELTAILEALVFIYDSNINSQITIFSDSSYAVLSITEYMDKWEKKNWKKVKNLDLMKAIFYLRNELPNVKYCHIPGHNGILGNEMADKICNRELDNNL